MLSQSIKVGQIAVRNMCGVKMELKVTKIDLLYIYCGPWKFDIHTLLEIDEELGWDNKVSGSFLEIE